MKFFLTSIIMFVLTPLAWGQYGIVPSQVENTSKLHVASSFLNQYATLVNATQTEDVRDKLRRTKENGFRYLNGNDDTLRTLTGTEDFAIDFDNGIYTARWSVDGYNKVTCTFPANISLLTFLNKIELENQLIDRLEKNRLTTHDIKLPTREISTLSPVAYSDFYLEDKGFYIIPRLKHQVIYEPEGKGLTTARLLTDTGHYTMESLANMMLMGYSSDPRRVNVKVSKYGYGSHTVDIAFSSLFKLLADEGSTPYWGVETYDGSIVNGLWVWINTEGGYTHMLSVTTPVTPGAPMEAKLHCYLRLDNLKSLFEEYPEL